MEKINAQPYIFQSVSGIKAFRKYYDSQNDLINEYYECLIDCDDDQHICKRICKEVLV